MLKSCLYWLNAYANHLGEIRAARAAVSAQPPHYYRTSRYTGLSVFSLYRAEVEAFDAAIFDTSAASRLFNSLNPRKQGRKEDVIPTVEEVIDWDDDADYDCEEPESPLDEDVSDCNCEWCGKKDGTVRVRKSCDSQDLYVVCADCHATGNSYYDDDLDDLNDYPNPPVPDGDDDDYLDRPEADEDCE